MTELDKIEQLVTKHCQDANRYDEALFNLGVETGRLLEKNKIQEYRPNLFVEFDKKLISYNLKNTQVKRIEKIISFLIVNAIAEQVENYGPFCFDSASSASRCDKLDEDIENKFFVQILSTTQLEIGGNFNAEFVINGQMAEVFVQYSIPLKVSIEIDNSSGGEDETFYKPDQVKQIFGVNIPLSAKYTDLDLDKLSSLAESLEKIQLFLLLKVKQIRTL